MLTELMASGSGGGGVTPDMVGKQIVRACDNQALTNNIVTSVIGIKKIKITDYSKSYSDPDDSVVPCRVLGWKTDGTYETIADITTTIILDVEDYYAIAFYRTGSNGYYAIWVVE